MKGRDILDFYKGGNLRKGGVDLENGGVGGGGVGGMTPLPNYGHTDTMHLYTLHRELVISFISTSRIFNTFSQLNT